VARGEFVKVSTRKKNDRYMAGAVLSANGPYCRYCGVAADDFGYIRDIKGRVRPWLGGLNIEHIVPLSRGGTHAVSNLAIACQSCNSRKGSKDLPMRFPPHPLSLGPPELCVAMDHTY
jgi:5-methylcytosine-specific restriction endonuclease McrA